MSNQRWQARRAALALAVGAIAITGFTVAQSSQGNQDWSNQGSNQRYRDDGQHYDRSDFYGSERGFERSSRYDDEQRSSRYDDDRYDRDTSSRSGRSMQGSSNGFSGYLEDFRRVTMGDDERTFVRLRFDDGRSTIVDLGPQVDLDDLQLRRNEWVSVRGRSKTIDGRIVLAATAIQTSSNTMRIPGASSGMSGMSGDEMQRSASSQSFPMRSNGSFAQTTVSGTIEEFRNVALEGQGDEHTIAVIRTREGRSKLVDLGPGVEPEEFSLEEGAEVKVRGHKCSIDDQPVVMAHALQVDGEYFDVQRPMLSFRTRDASLREASASSSQSTFRGRLESFEPIEFADSSDGEEHALVRLRLEDGRTRIVDLKSERNVQRLREGEQITVHGSTDRVDGRSVLAARQLRIGEQTLAISSQPSSMGGAREASAPRSRDDVRELKVRAANMNFSPETLTVEPGEVVRLTFENRSNMPHNMVFDLPTGDVAFRTSVPAGSSETIVFTAPSTPGTYSFHSPVENERERGMSGKLIVRPSDSRGQQQRDERSRSREDD